MDKFLLKDNIEKLSKNKKYLFENIMNIIGYYNNLIFLYGINLEHKNNTIVKDSIIKMKDSYKKIKNNSNEEYKKILTEVFLSDKKFITLKEAIEFIKNN